MARTASGGDQKEHFRRWEAGLQSGVAGKSLISANWR